MHFSEQKNYTSTNATFFKIRTRVMGQNSTNDPDENQKLVSDQDSWHKFPVICPNCQEKSSDPDIKFSADGQVLIECICSKCEEVFSWVKSWEWIIATCHMLDLEDERLLFPLTNRLKN